MIALRLRVEPRTLRGGEVWRRKAGRHGKARGCGRGHAPGPAGLRHARGRPRRARPELPRRALARPDLAGPACAIPAGAGHGCARHRRTGHRRTGHRRTGPSGAGPWRASPWRGSPAQPRPGGRRAGWRRGGGSAHPSRAPFHPALPGFRDFPVRRQCGDLALPQGDPILGQAVQQRARLGARRRAGRAAPMRPRASGGACRGTFGRGIPVAGRDRGTVRGGRVGRPFRCRASPGRGLRMWSGVVLRFCHAAPVALHVMRAGTLFRARYAGALSRSIRGGQGVFRRSFRSRCIAAARAVVNPEACSGVAAIRWRDYCFFAAHQFAC
jgi:hypothetical protein